MVTVAEVGMYKGAPTLFINGQPRPPFLFWYPSNAETNHVKDFAEAGIHLYTFGTNIGWVGPRRYDFHEIDGKMETLLEADPEALALLRSNCNSPPWWNELHPEELSLNHDGSFDSRSKASFASDLWLKEVSEALRSYIEHVRNSRYADRVFAYHIAQGGTGEWVKPDCVEGFYSDYSKPMTQAFRKWLHGKYGGDVASLRTAWNDPKVDFHNASIPSKEAQAGTTLYAFRQPSREKHVIDYYLYFADQVAEDIIFLCRTAKEASRNESLAGVFYGYIMDLAWTGAFFRPFRTPLGLDYKTTQHQRSGHMGIKKVLDSPYVDFLCSPYSYHFRGLGGDGAFMSLTESVKLHGKLWFNEDDVRTFLASPTNPYGRADTLQESVAVIERNFSNVITRGVGMWWMDQENKYFDHPELMKTISKLKRVGEASLNFDRSPSGGVAVIVDETSPAYQSVLINLMYPLILKQKQFEFGRMGTPYDLYLHDDLANPAMKDYKFYIFLNTFYLSKDEREVIEERVKRDGNTVLWIYASGFIDEHGASVDNVSNLTGINMGVDMDKWGLNVAITNFDHPITSSLPTDTWFGTDYHIGPIFYVNDPEAVTLGKLVYNRGRFKPGFAVKEFEDWTSIWVGAPVVPAEILRNIAKYAGVHLYSESGDILSANKNFLSLTTIRSEYKRFKLPRKTSVYDIFNNRVVAENVTEFTEYVPASTTALYFLGNPQLLKQRLS